MEGGFVGCVDVDHCAEDVAATLKIVAFVPDFRLLV